VKFEKELIVLSIVLYSLAKVTCDCKSLLFRQTAEMSPAQTVH